MENNMEISAMSYTNKDFRSMYPEMLDLAKQLTNRWDPSRSNESDPGVVLLKEAAFVADHNNYNIDKNILENFLPSATQDVSVRNICEMNGYTPRYYISANGEVTILWNKKEEDNFSMFTIPAFTLVLSDPENTVTYTQAEEIVVTDGMRTTAWFIEGTLQKIAINDTSTIHLDNLDDNNRLYFPESMVAQNGVYVKNANPDDYNDYWVRDNYLLTRPSGTRAYKIDYDSNKGLPYIEFPSDISNLIGDGLEIEYIATSGESGNVSANTLTSIISPSDFTIEGTDNMILMENISVWNSGSIANGKNPETIDEMYQSFRKTVGTFETLVTCKDYSDLIYRLADIYDNSYVSNVYVTDRRTDYNMAMNVITYDIETKNKVFKNVSIKPCSLSYKGDAGQDLPTAADPGDMYYFQGSLYVNTSTSGGVKWEEISENNPLNLNSFSILTSAMTPYDLCIYALKAFSIADYTYLNPGYSYNQSFTPISSMTKRIIRSEIEDVKCICHTYKDPDSNDVFCFKNYAPLRVMIWPYNKVKESVKNEILTNVYKALQINFNPRKLEFSKELEIDAIKKVIINADTRIKDVDLELSYNLKAMYANGNISDVTTSTALLTDIVAKNVLAGRICLFDFNNDFSFDYGQIDGEILRGTQIETEVPIKINNDSETTNYYTSSVNRTVTTLTSNDSDLQYYYVFSAPNFSGNSLTQGTSYVLTGTDSFTLYPYVNDKIIKSEAIECIPDSTTSYMISNSTTGAFKNSKTGPKTPERVPSGEIVITKDDIKTLTNEGILNVDYTLNKNEAVQIIHPNYYSEFTYSTYVNYRYIGTTSDRIYANTEHTLKAGEKLILLYSRDGETKQEVYGEGKIIRSSFNIVPTDELSANGVKKDWTDPNTGTIYENANFRQLASNQSISVRKPMSTVLNSSGIWCYWIVNNPTNTLFNSGEKTRILNSDEYFIYTNSSLDEMMILGSGTLLTRTDSDDIWWSIETDIRDINSISGEGTSANIPWKKTIDFVNYNFTITEMNVVTLGEGDRIIIFDWSGLGGDDNVINNDLQFCNGSIKYMTGGSETVLPAVEDYYRIKSRLDLNCSKDIPQRLYSTDKSTQKVRIGESDWIFSDREEGEEGTVYFQLSEPTAALGSKITFNDTVKLYKYKRTYVDDEGVRVLATYPRTIIIDYEGGSLSYPFFYSDEPDVAENPKKDYIIPLHIDGNVADITVEIQSEGDDFKIKEYNSSDEPQASLTLSGDSSYYLTPVRDSGSPTEGTELTLVISWPQAPEEYTQDEVVIIESISVVDGLNKDISIGDITKEDILSRIDTLISGSDTPTVKPYYTYRLDSSIAMDNTNFKDSNAAWDINNVINQMTIPQIDFDNSEFEFRKSMILDETKNEG